MKKHYYSRVLWMLALFSAMTANLNAQKPNQWINEDAATLDALHLQTRAVEDFNCSYNEPGYDLSNVLPASDEAGTQEIHTCIASKDSNFLIFVRLDLLKPQAEILKDSLSKTEYQLWVEKDLRHSLGTAYDSLASSIVRYMPQTYARKKFNADVVFTYPMNLKSGPCLGKYNHFQVVYLVKKGRGVVRLYSLYNDEGYWNQRKYNKGMEQIFWFTK